MKLCLVSDTHQQRSTLLRAVQSVSGIEAVLHAGDETSDADWLAKQVDVAVYAVAGNWDKPSVQHPLERVLEADGVRLFLTHGHRLRVKEGVSELVRRAMQHHAAIAVFGHTHAAVVERAGSLVLINPGSLSLPRGRRERTFVELELAPAPSGQGYVVTIVFRTPEGRQLSDLCQRLELAGGLS